MCGRKATSLTRLFQLFTLLLDELWNPYVHQNKLIPSIIASFLGPRLVLIDIACESVTLCHDRALRPFTVLSF